MPAGIGASLQTRGWMKRQTRKLKQLFSTVLFQFARLIGTTFFRLWAKNLSSQNFQSNELKQKNYAKSSMSQFRGIGLCFAVHFQTI